MKCKTINPGKDKFCIHYIESFDKSAGLCALPSNFRCIESLKHDIMKLSHSSLMSFLRCKRCYYYSNIKGLQLRPERLSQSILMGSIFDKKMCNLYDNTNNDIDVEYMTDISLAKVNAIMQIINDLGLKPQLDGYIGSQVHFDYKTDDIILQGFYDRKYIDHFVEMKFTGSPYFYLHPFEIQNQIGTYFLADEAMKYCIMEVTVVPQLRSYEKGKNRTKDELPGEYYERVYEAILRQPSKYFIGLNRKTGVWGKRFYRKEFNLESIKKRYMCVTTEIQESIERGWFYQNTSACNLYGNKCDYYDICKTGGYISEDIYTIRDKEERK